MLIRPANQIEFLDYIYASLKIDIHEYFCNQQSFIKFLESIAYVPDSFLSLKSTLERATESWINFIKHLNNNLYSVSPVHIGTTENHNYKFSLQVDSAFLNTMLEIPPFIIIFDAYGYSVNADCDLEELDLHSPAYSEWRLKIQRKIYCQQQ